MAIWGEFRTENLLRQRQWDALVLLILSLLPTQAAAGDLRFQRIGAAQGLSQPSILCAYQGERGFLWLCTQEGLNRFDGYSIKVYRHSEITGMTDSFASSLEPDPMGGLWIGTGHRGLFHFDPILERFRPLPLFPGPQTFRVHDLLLESDRQLWVAADTNGLWVVDLSDTGRAPRQIMSEADVRLLNRDSRGNLWIGTHDRGLWRLPPGDRRPVQISATPAYIRTLLEMPGGEMWSGTAEGILVHSIDTGSRLERPVPPVPDVMSLLADSRNRLWIGSAQGLYVVPEPEGTMELHTHRPSDPFSLSESFVGLIYEDRNSNIWVGTWLGGVNLLPSRADPFSILDNGPHSDMSWNNAATSVQEDLDGRIWTTLYRGVGAAYWDPGAGRWIPAVAPADRGRPGTDPLERIVGLDPDSGRIWSVANDGTLGFVDRGSTRLVKAQSQPLLGVVPEEIIVQDGRLYVATREVGVVVIDARTQAVVDQIDQQSGLASQYVQTVRFVGGRLWLGTMRGIAIYDIDTRQVKQAMTADGDGLSHNAITSIFPARDGTVWAGTQGGGLNRLQRDAKGGWQISVVDAARGLDSDAIGGIQGDDDGNLWVSTAAGVTRITPQGAIRNFGIRDGLRQGGFFIGSHVRGASGNIYFGGHGVLTVEPGDYELPQSIPSTVVTDYRVRNRPIPVTAGAGPLQQAVAWAEQVTVFPDDVLITLDFSAMRHGHADDLRYRYRLSGLGDTWIQTEPGRNQATFSHLPHGELNFEVSASFDGVEWGPVRRLALYSKPPWWRTAQALSLFLVLLMVALVLPIRASIQTRRERHAHQDAIQRSEQRLRMALWGSGDELWYYDASRRAVNLTYYDKETQQFVDQIPENPEERARLLHPDDRDKALRALDDYVDGKTDQIDVLYRARAGSDGWHWYQLRGMAVERDPEGKVLLVAGTRHDIHRRMSAMLALEELNQHLEEKISERTRELERTRDALVESEKMAALGTLVAGVAHELNTPIGISLTAASHLKDKTEEFEKRGDGPGDSGLWTTIQRGLGMVIQNMERATELIQSFKRVAVDQSVAQTTTFELRNYLSDIVTSLRPVYKNRYAVKVDCREPLLVHADPSAIYQIIQNLVVNSAVHGFEGIDSPEIGIDVRVKDGLLHLDYHDNGRGIDASIRSRIFEPFVTTARSSGSSGLGMHIVYNLVTQVFGGAIRCYEPEAGGAGFHIEIPLENLTAKQSA